MIELMPGIGHSYDSKFLPERMAKKETNKLKYLKF